MSALDVYSDKRKRERRSTLRRSLSPNNEVTRTISFLLYCVTSSCVADDTRDQITIIKINGLNNAQIAIHSRHVGQWPESSECQHAIDFFRQREVTRGLFAMEACETVTIITRMCFLILFNPTLIAKQSIKCQLSIYLADNLHFIGRAFI